MTRLAWLVVWLAVGCGRAGPEVGAARTHGLPHQPGPLDALARRLGRLRERMRAQGAHEESGPFRTFVPEGEGISMPLDLATAHCTTFVALGGGTIRDLVLSLQDVDGEEVARDDRHGEGGVVHVCPAPSVPGAHVAAYHLVALSRQGAGALLVTAFGTGERNPPDFDGLYDGVLAPRGAGDDALDRLTDARAALRARQLSPLDAPVVAQLAMGEASRTAIDLATDHCYTAIARGGAGLRDVDLYLFDPAGVEVARDLGEDAEPALVLCPEEAGTYTLQARAFRGAGAIAVQVLVGAREERGAVVGLGGVGGGDPELAARALAGPLVARGYGVPVIVVSGADIAPGEVRTHEIRGEAGCFVVLTVPGDDTTDLDLTLEGADGRELGRDTGVDATARAATCLEEPDVVRAMLRAYGTSGRYALAYVHAPTEIRDLAALRLDQAAAPFHARGYLARETRETTLAEGASFQTPLTVPEGRCLAVAVAGSESVADVDVYLRDADGTLVARDARPAPDAAVSRCSDHGETLALEANAYRGAGMIRIVVLEGPP